MKEKEGLPMIQHYLLALDLIHHAGHHLVFIENKIKNFEYSKPVNMGHKELDEIYAKLRSNFEKWQGKSAIDFDMTHKYKLEKMK